MVVKLYWSLRMYKFKVCNGWLCWLGFVIGVGEGEGEGVTITKALELTAIVWLADTGSNV